MEIIPHDKLVGHFRTRKSQYQINREYQRDPNIWSLSDEQYLIDSILRNYDLPKFYFRKMDTKDYEVVDGQQRLDTIWKFYDDNLWIPGDWFGYTKKRVNYSILSEDHQDQFDNFTLNGRALIDYDDEATRELFSRLQRGKPLNAPEKLNAFPGSIVPLMRELGNHTFFDKVKFSLSRYKHFHIAAKLLLIEKNGVSETQPTVLFNFFELNKHLDNGAKVAKKIKRVLNYLNKTFPDNMVPEISNEPWFINLYLLTSNLIENYSMDSKQNALHNFYIKTWNVIETARKTSSGKYTKFIDANTKGTNSRANIEIRFKFLMTNFLKSNFDLELLDPVRNFNHYEKTVIWRRDNKTCQNCGTKVEWKNYDADHIKSHVKAGPTTISNGQVLCFTCNRSLGKK